MKEYKLDIHPRILELLGPNLYTNIYYVLAELIANAYDADAHNVYIVSEDDKIVVEDDGHGMSYEKGEIDLYLKVGDETRKTEDEAKTRSGNRAKMGRKGVGKLAALSVSMNVDVVTKVGNEISGFVLSRQPKEDRSLVPIPEESIHFEYVDEHGSSIIMHSPQYKLSKNFDTVRKNLLRIFPLVSEDFRIHLIHSNKHETVDSIDEGIVRDLCTLITFGDEFEHLCTSVPNLYPTIRGDIVKAKAPIRKKLQLKNKLHENKDYTLEIKGWIGTYRSVRNRKIEISDFPDNFISVFANKKMGEFNILPTVGKNKLNEVYVVGQLHVDLFELTELPDMALSNRQGYKTDDPRYEKFLEIVRERILIEILQLREKYTDMQNHDKKSKKLEDQRQKEAALKKQIDNFQQKVTSEASNRIQQEGNNISYESVEKILSETMNKNRPDLGLKVIVDSLKKKILISQTRLDKDFADVIFSMLLHNNIPASEILYTNCDDEVCRIPEGISVYEYLRDFFIESYSMQKMFIVFITSKNTKKSWGALTEVGAAWITQIDNKIFNIHPFRPEHPLDDAKQWQSTNRKKGRLWMYQLDSDILCQKIEAICDKLNYRKQTREENHRYLKTLVEVR